MRPSLRDLTLLLLLATPLVLTTPASAIWPTDGRQVLSGTTLQSAIPVPDGSGGALIAFTDKQAPNPTVPSVFLQHVMSNGELDGAWPVRGRRLTTSTAGQDYPVLMRDLAGSWIATWRDSMTAGYPRLMFLKITAAGAAYSGWPANGVLATPNRVDLSYTPGFPLIMPDATGGVFVFWSQQDSTPGGASNRNIYGKHYTTSGSLASGWTAAGKLLVGAAGDQTSPRFVPDGAGGGILFWADNRNFPSSTQLFAMRIDGSGNLVSPWTAGGAPVVSASGINSEYCSMASDNFGGAVLGWGKGSSVYATRVSINGALLWPDAVNGMLISSLPGQPVFPSTITDGASGGLFAWSDYRAGFLSTAPDIYMQWVDGTGAARLTADGNPVIVAAGSQGLAGVVPSLNQGAIFVWSDMQISGLDFTQNIYAQRLEWTGTPQWALSGVQICGSGTAFAPIATTDGANGALVAWVDTRTESDTSIYMARISPAGVTGPAAVTVSGIAAQSSPGGVDLSWAAFLTGSATFQVYRADRREGPFLPVGAPIAASSSRESYAYHDGALTAGATYYYQLAWREQGDWQRSGLITAVAGQVAFALRPVQPNPARGAVDIAFQAQRPGEARIEVLDIVGRRVKTLLARTLPAGLGSVRWDGLADDGRPLTSGVYLVRFTSGARSASQRFVWMR